MQAHWTMAPPERRSTARCAGADYSPARSRRRVAPREVHAQACGSERGASGRVNWQLPVVRWSTPNGAGRSPNRKFLHASSTVAQAASCGSASTYRTVFRHRMYALCFVCVCVCLRHTTEAAHGHWMIWPTASTRNDLEVHLSNERDRGCCVWHRYVDAACECPHPESTPQPPRGSYTVHTVHRMYCSVQVRGREFIAWGEERVARACVGEHGVVLRQEDAYDD